MIIYSIVPEDTIFAQEDNVDTNRKNIVMDDGLILETRQDDQNNYEIVRIVSTDPAHYLQTEFYPGLKLSMSNRERF